LIAAKGWRPGCIRAMALVEFKLEPPIWVHLVLWPPLIIIGAIWLLRVLKAGLIALQYRHRLLGND
jgi:uncharacterized protein (DUF983 family)